MASLNRKQAIRIAPTVNGKLLASPWRIWAQGNEFYAAGMDSISHGKVSFHSGGRWVYTNGRRSRTLAKPIGMSDGWMLATQIQFMSAPAELPPALAGPIKAITVELPPRHKLVVSLFWHPEPRHRHLTPPREFSGSVLARHRLRSGYPLLVCAGIAQMSTIDLELAEDGYQKLRMTFLGSQDVAPMLRAEITQPSFSANSGNVFAVMAAAVPVTYAPRADSEPRPT